MSTTADAARGVLELRRYRLRPAGHAPLVQLFERHFIESQEALGIRLPGQFRDLDAADAFVWLRGFEDMASRASALAAFYAGPVWQAHREAANATMLDSDDVLLLRPLRPLALAHLHRPAAAQQVPGGLIVAIVCALPSQGADHALAQFEPVQDHLQRLGAQVLGCYASAPAANNFPRLPVRDDARVFVWFAAFHDSAAHAAHLAELSADAAARRALTAWHALCGELPLALRLVPTPRSLLRGPTVPPAGRHAPAGNPATLSTAGDLR